MPSSGLLHRVASVCPILSVVLLRLYILCATELGSLSVSNSLVSDLYEVSEIAVGRFSPLHFHCTRPYGLSVYSLLHTLPFRTVEITFANWLSNWFTAIPTFSGNSVSE
jgi:hypothetical protein